jgi:hypothetical protein
MLVHAKPGTIGTVAGTGEPAYAGDGGPATAACLNEPKSLAVDGAGRLYIADSENHVIRMVELATGIITTVAGMPGDSAPAQEPGWGRVVAPSIESEEDVLGGPSPAHAGEFTQVADLSGTVRFVEGTVCAAGRFEGDGGPAVRARLSFPSAVAIDDLGHLYIADTMSHRVRRVDAVTGLIVTIAGTGQRRFSGE